MYQDLICKYIDLLTPNHIKQYASSNHIYVSDDECMILCKFLKKNYKTLMMDESVLLQLKPKIRSTLYAEVVSLYQKNKTKFQT